MASARQLAAAATRVGGLMPMPLSDAEIEAMEAKSAAPAQPKGGLSDADIEALEAKSSPNPAPKPSPADSAMRGLSRGVTFGFADKTSAGVNAVRDYLMNKYGQYGDISKNFDIGKDYEKNLNAIKKTDETSKEANPWTYGAANLTGGVLSPVNKVIAPIAASGKGGTLAKMAAGAVGGGIAGAGESQAHPLNSPDEALRFGGDILQGAALGGATTGALDLVGKGISKLAPDSLREMAGERLVKAGTGQNKRAISAMRATGAADESGNALELAGRILGRADEAGPATVGFIDKAETILPKVQSKQKFFGKAIGATADAIDSAMPNAVDGKKISQKILDYAASLPETEQTKPIINRLMNEAQNFENRGQMSFADAQALKESFKFKPMDSSTHTFGQEASNKLNSIMRKEMNDTASQVAQVAPESSDLRNLAGNYLENKGKYQVYKQIGDAAQKRVDANLSNRSVAPSDYAAGATGLLASAAHGAGAIKSAVIAGAASLANRTARQYGSALMGRSMQGLADILDKSPEVLGKFTGAILDAANRGPNALTVTHALLMKNPEYSQIVGGQGP